MNRFYLLASRATWAVGELRMGEASEEGGPSPKMGGEGSGNLTKGLGRIRQNNLGDVESLSLFEMINSFLGGRR